MTSARGQNPDLHSIWCPLSQPLSNTPYTKVLETVPLSEIKFYVALPGRTFSPTSKWHCTLPCSQIDPLKPATHIHSAVPLLFTVHCPLLRQSRELQGSVKHKTKKLTGANFKRPLVTCYSYIEFLSICLVEPHFHRNGSPLATTWSELKKHKTHKVVSKVSQNFEGKY